MSRHPMVSVITPTWQRHKLLFSRCIPGVSGQGYERVEHVIVSDGPDPILAHRLAPNGPDGARNRWFYALPEHDPGEHWGSEARLAGIEMASGEFITYCDDDDFLRMNHCSLLAAALIRNPDCGFAISRMVQHGGPHDVVVGHGPLQAGNVGSPMIMHRREILDVATWDAPSWIEDWMLVQRWMAMGIRHADVDAETVDVWPSIHREKASVKQ